MTAAPATQPAPRQNTFRYFNGEKDVFGDPLRLQRELHLALGDPQTILEGVKAKDLESIGRLVEGVRTAFAMKPFDPQTGAGATEEDCRQAVESLWDYLAKKNHKPAS